MISKQLMAFFAGVTMVVACAGVFVLYNQKNGTQIQSDADNGSGDSKVSNDPTSGFTSYDGHKYNLHYGSTSTVSSSNQAFNTSYTIEFDSNEHGLLTGYVNNIKVRIGSTGSACLYHPGHNSISCYTTGTDPANSGLALLKQMQYVFTPLELKTDIQISFTREVVSGTITNTTYSGGGSVTTDDTYPHIVYYMNHPATFNPGKTAEVYDGNIYSFTVTLNDSGKTEITNGYYNPQHEYWLVIGNSIYPVILDIS